MKRNPEKELPILLHHTNALLTHCNDMLSKPIKVEETDHFGFMVLCFTFKQLEHLRSLVTLIEANHFADATTISRSMLEGMAILGWVRNTDTEKNALLWRGYVLVSDYKEIQKRKENDEPFDRSYEEELLVRIDELDCNYLTKKAKKDGIDSVPDPFQGTWLITESGEKITRGKIFEEIGSELYGVYSDFSQWPHWTTRGVCLNIKRKNNSVTFGAQSFTYGAQACATAVQSMSHIMGIMNEHFELGTCEKLEKILNAYKSDTI